jgi:hypothetical protein
MEKLRHIFAVAETLRVSLLQPQKRRKQPERYATFGLKFLKIYEKILTQNNEYDTFYEKEHLNK